jgi:hypothetical protein
MLRWLRAALRGEISAGELEPRRHAAAIAYSLAEEADARQGADRGAQLFRLCAWNAFALQTIADTLIERDAQADPPTAGYVPRSTLHFAGACVDEVPVWIRCARIAEGDSEARLAAGLPAQLPRWQYDEPTTAGELDGLRAAYEALQPRVETDVETATGAPTDARFAARARRALAEMKAAAEYAEALMRRDLGPVDRGEVRRRLLDALEQAFELGQMLALPTLVDVFQSRGRSGSGLVVDELTWLDVETGWHVLDRDRWAVGTVHRVRGDRTTGAFEGIDVDVGTDRPDVVLAPDDVATVEPGFVVLRARRDELGS